MSKRKNINISEYFYFTVDKWTRVYCFEVNRFKWELSGGHYAETDIIRITGQLRSKTKRNITDGEAHILPSFVPRDRREDSSAEQIGNVWTEKRTIYCSAFIPADAYFSLPASLAAEKFKEMEWRVNNLRYRKGEMDSIKLSRVLTDIND